MKDLYERAALAERILRNVQVPGFDVDVVSSGVVSRIRVSRDGSKVAVYVRFRSSDPGCSFCKFINHTLWKTIVDEIKKALASSGLFSEVYVFDDITLSEL